MLNQTQESKLFDLCKSWANSLSVPSSELDKGETEFTGGYLLPSLRQFVTELRKPELYVRGDKGPSVQPVVWKGMNFFPDLAIVTANSRHIAFEVKILRDLDPSGAFAKAIGQTSIYSNLGYKYGIGLIFDVRKTPSPGSILKNPSVFLGTATTQISVYIDEPYKRISQYDALLSETDNSTDVYQ